MRLTRTRLIQIRAESAATTKAKSRAQGMRSRRAAQLKAPILLLVDDESVVGDVSDYLQHGADDRFRADLYAGHGARVHADAGTGAEDHAQLVALAVDALAADHRGHAAVVEAVVGRCAAIAHRRIAVHDAVADVVVV